MVVARQGVHLNSSNIDFIFSGTSIDGPTSLTTKANFYFISFDSIKNSRQLHIYMNFGFFSLVGFGAGGIGFMAIMFPSQMNM